MMVGDVLALAEALGLGGMVQSVPDQDFFRRANANGAFEGLFALLISQMVMNNGNPTDSLPDQEVMVTNNDAQRVTPSVIQMTGTISEVFADVLEPENPTGGLVSVPMPATAEDLVPKPVNANPIIGDSSEPVHLDQTASVTLATNSTDDLKGIAVPLRVERFQAEETPTRVETAEMPLVKIPSPRGNTYVPLVKVLSDISPRVAETILHDSASVTAFAPPKHRTVEFEGILPVGMAVPPSRSTEAPVALTPERVPSLGTDLRVRYVAHPEKQTFLLHLEPESLGEVRVDISQTRGELSVKLSAATSLGREALMAHASLLKDSLVQQGLPIAQVTVEPGIGASLWHGQGQAPRQFAYQETSDALVSPAELNENAFRSGYPSRIAHAGALDLFV